MPPTNLYVLSVFLVGGPISEKFAKKQISRVIEIRGDQTLEQLHEAIFQAYDRWEQHLYEFQFGKRPFDPDGPNYGSPQPEEQEERRWRRPHDEAGRPELEDPIVSSDTGSTSATTGFTKLRSSGSRKPSRPSPTRAVIKRVGKSPPQYCEE